MNRWSRSTAAVLIVSLLAIGCYLNALGGPFLYDDFKDIARNPILTEPGHLSDLFKTSFLDSGRERGLYRPIVGLTYWIDHRLFGPNPFWFHLENVLWHAAASLLVLLLIRRLWPEEPLLALLGAALFAVHPVHTEAVTWVSGRSEVLATFWGLLAFVLHREADKKERGAPLWYFAALAAWLVALGAKEMAATVPLLLLLTDALQGSPPDWFRPGRLVARYGPFGVASAAYVALRWHVLGTFGPNGANQYFQGAPLSVRGPTMLKVAAAYAGRLVLPVNPNASWTVPHAKGIADGFAPLLALALLLVLLSLALALRKKCTPVAWGIFWGMIALFPVSNLLPIGDLGAERFLYWPSVGACVALAFAMAPREGSVAALRAEPKWLDPALRGLFGVAVVVLFAVNTVNRNRDWSSELALWTKTAQQSPESVKARINLGKALFEKGRVEEAVKEFEASLELSPDSVDGLNNLGAAYARLGRLEEAQKTFKKVTLLQPDHESALFNLGYLLYRKGDLDGAEEALKRAKAVSSLNPKTTYMLGVVAYKRNRLDEAEALWRETLSLDQGFLKARKNLDVLKKARAIRK